MRTVAKTSRFWIIQIYHLPSRNPLLKLLINNRARSNLVEEILHQVCNADIVKVSMSQQELLEVLQFWDGIIAVPHSLTPFFTFDTWRVRNNNNKKNHSLAIQEQMQTLSLGFLPMPT